MKSRKGKVYGNSGSVAVITDAVNLFSRGKTRTLHGRMQTFMRLVVCSLKQESLEVEGPFPRE